jgi:hypothetical protein
MLSTTSVPVAWISWNMNINLRLNSHQRQKNSIKYL